MKCKIFMNSFVQCNSSFPCNKNHSPGYASSRGMTATNCQGNDVLRLEVPLYLGAKTKRGVSANKY